MLYFPNAKINLGLQILQKRQDGFHDIDTCFYPLMELYEAIEFIEAEEDSIEIRGMKIDVAMKENIVYKALQMLRTKGHIPAQQIILQKSIPSGAGLGGGSADAAWTLRALRDKYTMTVSDEELHEMASKLGADVAFFLKNKPALAKGKGDILTDADIDLSLYHIKCVHPGVHVNTAWAYSQAKPKQGRKTVKEILSQDISTWKSELENDFEEIVFPKFPELKQVKATLYEKGAIYASMSGSGSSFFGIFPN